MSIAAVITMIIMLTIVWGGFAFALRTAFKKETQKAHSEK